MTGSTPIRRRPDGAYQGRGAGYAHLCRTDPLRPDRMTTECGLSFPKTLLRDGLGAPACPACTRRFYGRTFAAYELHSLTQETR